MKDIEDEIPFEVPEGWAWCRLKEIGTIITGNTPSKNEVQYYNSKDIHFYKPSDLEQGINTINSEDYVSLLGYEKSRKLPKNSILVTCIGATIGKTGLIREEGTCNQQINAILPSNIYIPELIYYWCISAYTQTKIKTASSSTTLPILNKDGFSKIVIPLPPLVEQNQIVSKIGNFFEIIDSLETDKSDLQIAIKQTKSKILDLAIHGKLVTQDESDEPASVLLERLRAEKEAKIKAGELKRDKNDSYIYKNTTDNCYYEKFQNGTEELIEVPYNLPESWSWSRLGSICDYGKCKNASVDELNDKTWVLDLEDIEKDTGKILKFETLETRNSLSTKHVFKKGDILYSKLRPYLNKVVIAPKDGVCTSEILPLDFNGILINEYAQYLLMSSYFLTTVNLVTYGVKMPRLGTDDAKKMLLPVPPLNEQLKIICSVKKLQESLDEIILNLV